VAATHLHLGKRVAIKLLLPGAPVRADAFERFLREGRAAARLRSEHVARVHDAGVLATGEPYLVLEYLKGVDLRTLLRERGPLSIDTALTYVLQVCEALAEAHALGIVHRDLKPGNIFLTRRADGSESVKVIDFGISKVTSPDAGAGAGEESPLTRSDGPMGTPTYMAPEQMRRAHAADARADIWSLGAVLHGLLTGASPFAGESMIEVYDRILAGAPSLRAARPDVPAELDAVVRRCLSFDRDARFDDVGQLAAALAELAPEEARVSADRAQRTTRGAPLDDARPSVREPAGASESATIEVSFTREHATTSPPREPSWPGDDDPERASQPRATIASEIAPSDASPRVAVDRRARTLLVVGAVTIALGAAAAGYALHSLAAGAPPSAPSAIAAPALADPIASARPATTIAPLESTSPPSPAVTASATMLTPLSTVPHRTTEPALRVAAPRPVPSASAAPTISGLAATPD
jgi:serine/threonine-protein kinase